MIHLPSGKKYIGQHKNNNIAEREQTHKYQFNYFCKKKMKTKNVEYLQQIQKDSAVLYIMLLINMVLKIAYGLL
jgi:hypothetical protein